MLCVFAHAVAIWEGSWGCPSQRLSVWRTWESSPSSPRFSWDSTLETKRGKTLEMYSTCKRKLVNNSPADTAHAHLMPFLLVESLFNTNGCLCLCSQWLYDLSRGVDFETVKPRQLPKSIGCSKNFAGNSSLGTIEQVRKICIFIHYSKM